MNNTKKECYRLIQEIALLRDPICVHPGCRRRSVAGHHIWRRNILATAFEPDAVQGVCEVHHRWVHQYPKEAHNMFAGILGRVRWEELKALSKVICHRFDFEAKRTELKRCLDRYQKQPPQIATWPQAT